MASAYYNEIDPFAVQWLRNLIKRGLIAPGEVDDRSIEDVTPADLVGFDQCHFFAGIGIWSHSLRQAGWADNRKVWTGSCPCQPFSTAGKGDGTADERHLWPAFHYLIQECRPEFVLGEQVEAAIRHGWLDTLQADLEGIGYTSGAVVLPAAGVGAPHIRSRLWWVGYTNDEGLEGHTGDGDHGGRSDSTGSATSSVLSVGGVGDSNKHGRSSGSQATEAPGYGSPTDTAGRTNGFWRDADWLPFENAKQRPVKSGLMPVVDGGPLRMGELRAYGNAIVAPLATEFIKAVMACKPG